MRHQDPNTPRHFRWAGRVDRSLRTQLMETTAELKAIVGEGVEAGEIMRTQGLFQRLAACHYFIVSDRKGVVRNVMTRLPTCKTYDAHIKDTGYLIMRNLAAALGHPSCAQMVRTWARGVNKKNDALDPIGMPLMFAPNPKGKLVTWDNKDPGNLGDQLDMLDDLLRDTHQNHVHAYIYTLDRTQLRHAMGRLTTPEGQEQVQKFINVMTQHPSALRKSDGSPAYMVEKHEEAMLELLHGKIAWTHPTRGDIGGDKCRPHPRTWPAERWAPRTPEPKAQNKGDRRRPMA